MGEFPTTWATTRVDQVAAGRVLSGVSNVVSPRLQWVPGNSARDNFERGTVPSTRYFKRL